MVFHSSIVHPPLSS